MKNKQKGRTRKLDSFSGPCYTQGNDSEAAELLELVSQMSRNFKALGLAAVKIAAKMEEKRRQLAALANEPQRPTSGPDSMSHPASCEGHERTARTKPENT